MSNLTRVVKLLKLKNWDFNPDWLDCSNYIGYHFRVSKLSPHSRDWLAKQSCFDLKKSRPMSKTHQKNHSCVSTDKGQGPPCLSYILFYSNCLSSLILPHLSIKIVVHFLIFVFCIYVSCLYRKTIWGGLDGCTFIFFTAKCFQAFKAATYWKLLH